MPRDRGIRSLKLREADRLQAECECGEKWNCEDYRDFDEMRESVVRHILETGHRATTQLIRHNLLKRRGDVS